MVSEGGVVGKGRVRVGLVSVGGVVGKGSNDR